MSGLRFNALAAQALDGAGFGVLAATLRLLAVKRGDRVEVSPYLNFSQSPELLVADAVLTEDDGGESEGA